MIDVPSPYKIVAVPFTTIPDRHRPRTAHITQVRRFAASLLNSPADARTLADEDFPDNEVDHFTGHIKADDTGELWFGVRWYGCGPEHDTRLPVHQLVEDVPDLVKAYLLDNKDDFPDCSEALAKHFP